MNWLALVQAFFKAIESLSDAIKVRTKPVDVQVSEHQIKVPRMTVQEKDRIADICFKEIKNNTEIDIANYVNYATDVLNEQDRIELIQVLTERVLHYRKQHPLIFKKWLHQQVTT